LSVPVGGFTGLLVAVKMVWLETPPWTIVTETLLAARSTRISRLLGLVAAPAIS